MKKNIFLFFCIIFLVSCKKKQDSNLTCTDSESLFTKSQFPIGVAINMGALQDGTAYKKIATEQFNSITPENIFKASFIHPYENTFNWLQQDELATFCKVYQKRLHGHTLIWHEQLPAWIWNFEGSRNEWESLMKTHIQTIVSHFKGAVSSWDVVNEAFEEDGTLRNTIWKQKVGDDYIEKAFIYAHEADPNVLLFYNDYQLEANFTKRKNVLNYFERLRTRGVIIDGIGLQMHITTSYPEPQQVGEALKEISSKHYKIHFSEVDISINPFGKSLGDTKDLFKTQAMLLGEMIEQYKGIPSQYQYGVTFWGISDKDSWLRNQKEDYPLLYNDNYNVKPAYCELKKSL